MSKGRAHCTLEGIIRSILRIEVRSVLTRRQIRKSHTAMDNPRSALVVLLLRNPHVLEGRQAGKDRPSNPDTVLAFRRGDDSDFYAARREISEFFGHAVGDARVHGRSTREDDVAVPKGMRLRIPPIEGKVRRTHRSRRISMSQAVIWRTY